MASHSSSIPPVTDISKVYQWKKLTAVGGQPPKPRFGHTMTLVKNKLIVFGGGGSDGYHDGVMSFNIDTLRWQAIEPSGTVPPRRAHHSATVTISTGVSLFLYSISSLLQHQ